MTTQCYVYDFTLPQRELTVGLVHALLRAHCKTYTFQLERGDETGYQHYQGRLSLIKKKRTTECARLFPDTGIHVTPTSNNAREGPPFYCLKADTRLEGPWTDKDYVEPKPLTRQLQVSGILESRYPWQDELIDRMQHFDMRTIHMVICSVGGEGKSMFAEYLEYRNEAFEVPPFTCMEDIMQCVMGVPSYRTYLIDMPRAMPKNRLAGFFAGIESLKNGVMYDKRYHFKKRRIDRPNIIVFSNKAPKRSYLSRDRWRLWTISRDKRLIDYCFHGAEEEEDDDRRQQASEDGSDVDEEVLLEQESDEDTETDSS